MHLYLKGHGLKGTKIRSNDILKSSLGLHFRQTQNNSILNGTEKMAQKFRLENRTKKDRKVLRKILNAH